jgi:hypothetical protein
LTVKIDLTTDEAQLLLDGINVVIKEKCRDLRFWANALPPSADRDTMTDQFKGEIILAESARAKVQTVA